MWLVAFLVSCCCAVTLAAAVPVTIKEAGFSDQYKSENTLGEYTFGYNEDHTTGGSFRRETSDHLGNKFGSYGLRIGDGRVRVVNYVADQNGFRADVFSNEPGVESQLSNQFSKITKKGIFGVLVPGFRYSSMAPHVTFERRDFQTRSSFRGDGEIVGGGNSFSAGGDVTNNYAAEGDPTNVLRNRNFDDAYSRRQLDSNIRYNDHSQWGDSFLDGGYSHESEIIASNGTTRNRLEQKASNGASTEVQKQEALHSASTSNSEQVDDKKVDGENQHSLESFTTFDDDLNSFQSAIVMRKEPLASTDKNSTLPQATESNGENATSSTVAEA